ncbi:hypothetical protein PR202_gb04230 [Eleusine coracana subsp. coracana]|uniref:DUF6598 domain-containing protein n=1 Tax=Eleusine coracana subsp. coracana TaxID=191504 RepID=A0AAV5E3G8_ELECO|nr:hypothetical protein PR202_gb04230 [Eleusine coracana subsp. coracana]
MRYAFTPAPKYTICENALQIFSVKVAKLKDEDIGWPLHVYGLIATRDSVDPRRNLLFHRTRDDYQILTQELTGPSRAIVLIDLVKFEVQLKAKGRTESEDKILNFNVFPYNHFVSVERPPSISTVSSDCSRSELEFTLAPLVQTVERPLSLCMSFVDHGPILFEDRLFPFDQYAISCLVMLSVVEL